MPPLNLVELNLPEPSGFYLLQLGSDSLLKPAGPAHVGFTREHAERLAASWNYCRKMTVEQIRSGTG